MKELCAQRLLRQARGAAVACWLCGSAAWAAVPAAASGSTAPAAASGSAAPAAASGAVGSVAEVERPDPTAIHFLETCSGCHTVGGGVTRGPDLVSVAPWPLAQLTAAVKSMERKVGPLSTAQIEALADLLKASDAQQRLSKAKARSTPVSGQTQPPPDSRLGGALFFGQVALQNGGLSCSSCHRYRGEGGELGLELSQFAANSELEALAGTIARAGFPVMRAAFAAHPITAQESRHIAAFMLQAKSQRTVAALSATMVWGLSAGLVAFGIAVALIWARPKGVRARLIQRTTKR